MEVLELLIPLCSECPSASAFPWSMQTPWATWWRPHRSQELTWWTLVREQGGWHASEASLKSSSHTLSRPKPRVFLPHTDPRRLLCNRICSECPYVARVSLCRSVSAVVSLSRNSRVLEILAFWRPIEVQKSCRTFTFYKIGHFRPIPRKGYRAPIETQQVAASFPPPPESPPPP